MLENAGVERPPRLALEFGRFGRCEDPGEPGLNHRDLLSFLDP